MKLQRPQNAAWIIYDLYGNLFKHTLLARQINCFQSGFHYKNNTVCLYKHVCLSKKIYIKLGEGIRGNNGSLRD